MKATTRRLLLATVLVGCSKAPDGSPPPGTPGGPAGSSTPVAAPKAIALPLATRPAVRDDTVTGPFVDGVALEIRALRSHATTADSLGFAVRLRPEKASAKDDPQERLDWTQVLPMLRFEVKAPDGATHVLEVAEPTVASSNSWPLAMFRLALAIDGSGLAQGTGRTAWTTTAPGLLSRPGAYSLTVSGSVVTSRRTLAISAGPLRFTVVEAGEAWKPLVDIELRASEIARATWGAPDIQAPSGPTVEDVDGNLSVRFRRSSNAKAESTGYDDEILEIGLDPKGEKIAVDQYSHFTCVAEGTPIATPEGPIPIERVTVGSRVHAFDVETGARSIAVVLRVDRSRAESLRAFGALRVTKEHPLWADGAWRLAGDVAPGAELLGVDLQPLGAEPVVLDMPATVFDIGVSSPHTYFAGGVLVHNKADHVPLGGRQPWGDLFHRRAAKR